MSQRRATSGTVGTLNTLSAYRRYLRGEVTSGQFQAVLLQKGFTVEPVDTVANEEHPDADVSIPAQAP